MITFANSLDPDHARQNVGPDLDPICLTLLQMEFPKEFLEKVDFEKISRRQKSIKNSRGQSVNPYHAGPDISHFENSVDDEQLASQKPADLDLHCFQNFLNVHSNNWHYPESYFDKKGVKCSTKNIQHDKGLIYTYIYLKYDLF